MGRYEAKDAFNRLAEAYLIVCGRSEAAQTFVRDLRADHHNAVDDYYFHRSSRENSKKALKNDLKGGFK